MTTRTKIIIAIVVLVVLAVVIWYMFKGDSATGADWKVEALKITGTPYNQSSLDWNGIASAIQVNYCGLGAGDAAGPCLTDKQDKVIGFFKMINVQPTGSNVTANKKTVEAYLASGEAKPHYSTTVGELKQAAQA